MELFALVWKGSCTGVFLNAVFSFFVSVFPLPAALGDFYQNIFMTVSAKHPIARLEQVCLRERQEGLEEQMVLKKPHVFSPCSASGLKQVQVTLLIGFFFQLAYRKYS